LFYGQEESNMFCPCNLLFRHAPLVTELYMHMATHLCVYNEISVEEKIFLSEHKSIETETLTKDSIFQIWVTDYKITGNQDSLTGTLTVNKIFYNFATLYFTNTYS